MAGIGVEAELVARLVADTGTGEALPLLAFTLNRLADGAGRGDKLSLARYEELGGVRGALVRQADATLAEARNATGRGEEQVLAGLLRLVTVDEVGRPSRWRVPREELPAPVRVELDAFIARRLLSTDTENDAENGVVVVGVAHEAFLSAWQPLTKAIAGAVTALRTRRAVEQAAIEWDTTGRSHSRLWERGQLAAAVRDLGARTKPAHQPATTREPATATATATAGTTTAGQPTTSAVQPATAGPSSPSPSQSRPQRSGLRGPRWLRRRRVLATDKVDLSQRARAFLHTSIRVDRRRRARATTILSVLLTLALTLAGVAEVQRRDAQDQQRLATSRQLITQAETARNSDPRAALRLGIAAQHLHPDRQTRASLINTLTSTHYDGTLTGHTDAVTAVDFAPDGRTLATAGGSTLPYAGEGGGRVILWDLTDPGGPRRLGEPLTGHTRGVSAVAFAPDGRTLATVGDNSTVILWDVTDPGGPARLGERFTGHTEGDVYAAFAPDGRTLAMVGWTGKVILWDLTDPGAPARLGELRADHPGLVSAMAFAPDGRTLATASGETLPAASEEGTVILWDLTDPGAPARRGEPLTVDSGGVTAVAFAPDGRTLATVSGSTAPLASEEGTVILWDLSDPGAPARRGEPLTVDPRGLSAVAFAPDGRTLATASMDEGTVILWDLSDPGGPARRGEPLTGHTAEVGAVAFAPDGRTLAAGGFDRTVVLWDLTDPGAPARLGEPLAGQTYGVSAVAFAPDGRTLATAGSRPLATGGETDTVILWHLSDPGAPARLGEPLTGNRGETAVAFTPDGRPLATGGDEDTVILWDLTDPGAPARLGELLTGQTDGVSAVAFTPDGRTLVTAAGSRAATQKWDGTVILWDLTDPGAPVRRGEPLPGHTDFVHAVALAPDGRTLATAGEDRTVILWDLTDPGAPARRGAPLTGHTTEVGAVGFAPDGRTLATAGGRDLGKMKWDFTVILWDLSDRGAQARLGEPLTGHPGEVLAVAFTPDGRTLATAGGEGTVILWDLSDPSAPARLGEPLTGHPGGVAAVAFAPDGRALATAGRRGPGLAGEGGTVILWDLTDLSIVRDHPAEQACQVAGGALDRAEWARYIPGLPYQDTCPAPDRGR